MSVGCDRAIEILEQMHQNIAQNSSSIGDEISEWKTQIQECMGQMKGASDDHIAEIKKRIVRATAEVRCVAARSSSTPQLMVLVRWGGA